MLIIENKKSQGFAPSEAPTISSCFIFLWIRNYLDWLDFMFTFKKLKKYIE